MVLWFFMVLMCMCGFMMLVSLMLCLFSICLSLLLGLLGNLVVF